MLSLCIFVCVFSKIAVCDCSHGITFSLNYWRFCLKNVILLLFDLLCVFLLSNFVFEYSVLMNKRENWIKWLLSEQLKFSFFKGFIEIVSSNIFLAALFDPFFIGILQFLPRLQYFIAMKDRSFNLLAVVILRLGFFDDGVQFICYFCISLLLFGFRKKHFGVCHFYLCLSGLK